MPKNRLIYLASPYSHPDPAVMQQRYEQVCEATAALLRAGYMVYSPIVHSHPLTEYGLPTEWAYWERLDTRMIEACDALWVLTLDGWKESTGVACEMRIAQQMGKRICTYWEARVASDLEEAYLQPHRTCARCHRRLPLAEFKRDKRNPSGVNGTCKRCDRRKK